MYNISFETRIKGKLDAHGFTTSMSPNIEDAFEHFQDEIDLDGVDEITMTINPIKFENQ